MEDGFLKMQSMSKNIEKNLSDFFKDKWGYTVLPPEGLLNPLFPDTFAASAFHESVVSAARKGPNENNHKIGAEWCFRHVDIEKVGVSPIYLSVFRMLVFFDVFVLTDKDDNLKESMIEKFVAGIKHIGLDPQNLTTTYFGGGKIRGVELPADDKITPLWEKHGVKNIVPIAGETNFTNVKRTGEPAGPRCEVFYNHPSFSSPVEIGTVVFERYILGKTLDKAKGLVYGGALGIERLAMLQENKSSIFECSLLSDAVEVVTKELGSQLSPIVQSDVLRLADALRSLAVIFAAIGELPKGKHRERINKIANIAKRSFQAIGILEKEKIECITNNLVSTLDLYELESAQPKSKLAKSIFSLLV